MLESQFQSRVISFLKQYPEHIWFVKVWGGGYQKSGIPDILCCINGKFMAIELKSLNGKPTVLQKRNIELINKTGGLGIILYPDGFDDFKKLIKELIDCKPPTHV